MARNIGVNFNGQHLVHPQAKAAVDASNLSTIGNADAKRLIFLGSAEGGQPGTMYWFDNPTDAKAVFRSGNLADAAELAWSPSLDGSGAGQVGFLRVEDAKQASLVKGNMTIQSKDWGNQTNKIQVKLEDGGLAGSKKLTAYFWPDNLTEVYDNLGPIFTIQYKGDQAYAGIDIAQDQNGKATTLTIKVGADSASAQTILTYPLGDGQFAEVNKLVFDINEHSDFTASVVTAGNKNINTGVLDAVAAQDIKAAPFTVTALEGDLLNQVSLSSIISVSFAETGEFPENFGYEYLQGGTSGTVPASWISKLNLLYGEGAYFLVPLTDDEAIHAEFARFIDTQTNIEGNRMLGLYGGALGESVDDAIARAITLNDSRAVVCYPGITLKDSSSSVRTLPCYMTAALVAGLLAGKETGDPITLDWVNLIGLEKILTGPEIDRLIEGGVTALEFVRNSNRVGYRIAQGVTTYQVDSNPSYREISMRIVTDELDSELEEILESGYAGGKGTVAKVALIKNDVQSFLDRKKREEVIVDYLPESVQVTLEGDKVTVTYQAMPVGAINYILIKTTYYQQTITA